MRLAFSRHAKTDTANQQYSNPPTTSSLSSTLPTTLEAEMAPNRRQGTTRRLKYTDPPLHEQVEQPATTAVLSTNELLTQILSEVPLENRVDLRRVCKTWNDIISKVGFQAKPIDIHCCCAQVGSMTEDIPHYSPDTVLKVNTGLNSHIRPSRTVPSKHWLGGIWIEDLKSIDENALHFTMYPDMLFASEATKLTRSEAQFITKPPITRALLHSCVFTFGNINIPRPVSVYATLSIPGGIKVRDLLHGLKQTRASLARALTDSNTVQSMGRSSISFVLCRHGADDT